LCSWAERSQRADLVEVELDGLAAGVPDSNPEETERGTAGLVKTEMEHFPSSLVEFVLHAIRSPRARRSAHRCE
jgi:hypothetical protein